MARVTGGSGPVRMWGPFLMGLGFYLALPRQDILQSFIINMNLGNGNLDLDFNNLLKNQQDYHVKIR